jgi:hypothetical protein
MEHMIPIRRIIEFKEFHSANRKILHGIRSKLFISESTFHSDTCRGLLTHLQLLLRNECQEKPKSKQ